MSLIKVVRSEGLGRKGIVTGDEEKKMENNFSRLIKKVWMQGSRSPEE